MLSDGSSRVFRRDQRYVNQMLAQEPRLKLICAQDFADEKIIGASSPSSDARLTSLRVRRVMIWCASSSGESCTGTSSPPAGRPFDLRGLGHVRRQSDTDAAQRSGSKLELPILVLPVGSRW